MSGQKILQKGLICMEKFTQKEKELHAKLESKRKRIEREMKQFYKDADEHKEELLRRWGIVLPEDALEPSAETYETEEDYQNDYDNFDNVGRFV